MDTIKPYKSGENRDELNQRGGAREILSLPFDTGAPTRVLVILQSPLLYNSEATG